MINFCTLFDSNYLTRGLALYESLENVCSSFHLYVVAFNKECYDYLKKAGLANLTVIVLSDFEDEYLLKIKPIRSAAEYCWTCTPSVILFCIKKYGLHSCTYIDADMIFYHDPKVLIEEMDSNSILITEHRYTKDYNQSKYSGIYCVQLMCFKNDHNGMRALNWWRDRCIEWCYARHEDGKFGDQKYLDDWLTRFEGVHVLQHPAGGVAPWNLQQFRFFEKDNSIFIGEKKSGAIYPLIFFHFHGVKFYTDNYISCCEALYQIENNAKEIIYLPYFNSLITIEDQLRKEGVKFNVNGARTVSPGKGEIVLQYFKHIFALWKLGNIKYPSLQFFNVEKHNHFYKAELIKQKIDGRADRS
jgi:hypothetical protein